MLIIFKKYYAKPICLWVLAILISASYVFAQNKNVSLLGKVIDSRGNVPLQGATIQMKGTTHAVVTDKNGEFRFITAQRVPLVYVVSYVGYKTVELPINQYGHILISLQESDEQLSDVVVVGYGEQSRKTVTSAVSTISPKKIANVPTAGIDQLLQGQAGGVLATANTSVPGSKVFLRIRGTTSINASNDPLYIVDGVFINNRTLQSITTGGQQSSPIADLNPADIESIEVLKDATATAIYGSRGANGVILITTKHGKLNSR